MLIAVASDSKNVDTRDKVIEFLQENNINIVKFCSNDIFSLSCEISDQILSKKADKGILIDDYGNIPFMICSKHKNLICAQISDEHSAKMTRDHNNTQIITLGSKISGIEVLKNSSLIFSCSDYSAGRHQIRVDMLNLMIKGDL